MAKPVSEIDIKQNENFMQKGVKTKLSFLLLADWNRSPPPIRKVSLN